ncbi:DeoR/GlpR transcriptional regulator [Halomonas eurihalina]|uniref:DeoR/GlpR transcriptional regulator n=1 Tax=Halomonas eurihalina TaxID=42566 RepID=A0A5D9DEY3_HALER|nr:DeoR family transcriptional regulator [Halomonas eurihalina]MDR5858154.1 DeoR family transcriptional regulator [Halomonas eurihalina]TZG41341.1 DeoR/GlpR transcriptional regulator [Halomonas eurihalina]
MPRSLHNALKRRLSIAEHVRDKGDANVNELAEQYGVTTVTIRTDLQYLEDQGYLIRSFGGARCIDDPAAGTDAFSLLESRFRQAYPVAYQAALQVKPGDHVFLAGSVLAQRMAVLLSGIPELHIISDAPALVSVQNHTPLEGVQLTGGIYDSAAEVLYGWGEALANTCRGIDCSFIDLGGDPDGYHPASKDYIALCGLSDRNIGIIRRPGIPAAHLRVLEHLTEVLLLAQLKDVWSETLIEHGFQQQQIQGQTLQFKRARFRTAATSAP